MKRHPLCATILRYGNRKVWGLFVRILRLNSKCCLFLICHLGDRERSLLCGTARLHIRGTVIVPVNNAQQPDHGHLYKRRFESSTSCNAQSYNAIISRDCVFSWYSFCENWFVFHNLGGSDTSRDVSFFFLVSSPSIASRCVCR